MGEIIRFHSTRSSAISTSEIGRDASLVKTSEVTPPAIAVFVRKSENHQSSGMLRRCHHLLTKAAVQPAPISLAQSSREDQSSMIERNEMLSDMPNFLGPFVLKSKAQMSRECEQAVGQNVLMSSHPKKRYDQEFIGRVRAAREARYGTQTEIAVVLGMSQDKYKQYEVRSLLPHELIPRFCIACGISLSWLMAAEGPGPKWQPYIHKPRSRVRAVRRKAA